MHRGPRKWRRGPFPAALDKFGAEAGPLHDNQRWDLLRWRGPGGERLGKALFDEGAQGGAVAGGGFLGAAQERGGDFEGGFYEMAGRIWVPSLRDMGGWVKRRGFRS